MNVGLLGGSFDTPNMGVAALAEASIKLIRHRWPDANIVLIGSWKERRQYTLEVGGHRVTMENVPVRFCRNPLLSCHFAVLLLTAWTLRLLPFRAVWNRVLRRNACARMLADLDIVFDITGGDSFSDIYGIPRFAIGTLRKLLILQFRKRLVLLPQTYGPFEKKWTRVVAASIMKRAHAIYARDRVSLEYVRHMLGHAAARERVHLSPDMAFILDPHPHQKDAVPLVEKARREGKFVLGLNVSGLLYNGGYTGANEFRLKTDYRRLAANVARRFLAEPDSCLVLVPHEFDFPGSVVGDPDACRRVYEEISPEYPGRVILISQEHSQNEIKHAIGLCGFFAGSRMHACIAAMSQHIPTVGLAYSRKFAGVFETIGMGQWAVDLREADEPGVLKTLSDALLQRQGVQSHLERIVPETRQRVLSLFSGIS